MQDEAKRQVQQLFDRQEGLAAVAQLLELGLSREVIRSRVLRGPWRLVLPRVVCGDARALDARQRLMAALLMAAPDSVISSWSAATWHGLRSVADERRVVVAVPAHRFVRSHGFVVVRRTRRPDPAVVRTTTLAVSSCPRAVADAARELGPRAARPLVIEAVQQRLVTLADLRHELEAGPRQGSLALRTALREAEQQAWSVPEADLAALVRTSSVLPEMWANPLLSVGGLRLSTPDGWFDDVALAVQVHSRQYHAGELDWERTVSADGVFAEHGIALVAVTPRQIVHDARSVLQRVERAHEQAAKRPRPAVIATRRSAT